MVKLIAKLIEFLQNDRFSYIKRFVNKFKIYDRNIKKKTNSCII